MGYFGANSVTFGSTTLTNPHPGFNQIFVVKYDSAGNVQWAKTASSTGAANATTVAADGNGNVYVSGNYNGTMIVAGDTLTNDSTITTNLFLIKYDGSGNTLWVKQNKTYSDPQQSPTAGSEPTNIICDNAGNVVVVGFYYGADSVVFDGYMFSACPSCITASSNYGGFFIKYNASGMIQWVKSGYRSAASLENGISVDPIGNIFISGAYDATMGSASSNGSIDELTYYLFKFDTAGNSQWSKSIYGSNLGVGASPTIYNDALGNIYINGLVASGAGFPANEIILDGVLLRIHKAQCL